MAFFTQIGINWTDFVDFEIELTFSITFQGEKK